MKNAFQAASPSAKIGAQTRRSRSWRMKRIPRLTERSSFSCLTGGRCGTNTATRTSEIT